MEIGHFIGIIIALAVLIGVGMYSANRVKNAADFDTGGGRGSVFMVSGLLLGSLIGGQCTIGTAKRLVREASHRSSVAYPPYLFRYRGASLRRVWKDALRYNA